jgi:hypothetical protein
VTIVLKNLERKIAIKSMPLEIYESYFTGYFDVKTFIEKIK